MGVFLRTTSFVRKLFAYIRESGFGPVAETALRAARERRAYQRWIRKHGSITQADRDELTARIAEFGHKPLISVILPVFNTDEVLLRKCVGSVINQIYDNWEICIADDASTEPYIRPLLAELSEDKRIKIVFRESNGHISAASNSALEMATGEFCVLLDHDDELSEDALFWVAHVLKGHPGTMIIYSDEDLIDEDGRRSSPKFKPAFSRDLLLGINLVTHLSAYRTFLLKEIGGFRIGFEGSQDYDLALRVVERLKDGQIRHIPKILYHWRVTAGSLARDLESKPYAHETARRAIREYLERTGKKAQVVETGYLHRVRYSLPEPLPPVSLILSGHREARADEWAGIVRDRTDYSNLEIIEVGDRAVKAGDKGEAKCVGSTLNWTSRLNAAAADSAGGLFCFLDSGIRPLSSDWLRELVSFAIQPEIGVVGPRLLHPNNTIAGTGLLIGVGGIVAATHDGFLRNSPGNMSRNRLISNISAVSSSCMIMRREIFDSVGGFDEEYLSGALYGAELCLRVREQGFRVTVTPFAELKFQLGQTRDYFVGRERDGDRFLKRWKAYVDNDPFLNPNLSKVSPDFSIKV